MKTEFELIESCEEIGEFQDEYVYDIEIDTDTEVERWFFANDILVHNSVFFSYAPVLESADWPEGISEKDIIFRLYDNIIDDFNTQKLNEYAHKYGVENIQELKLEKYSESAIFLAKKSYIAHVRWDEGIEKDPFEFIYTKGFDIVRSNTAPFARENVVELIKYLFENPDTYSMKELVKMVREIKDQFQQHTTPENIQEICLSTSTNKLNEHIVDDRNELVLAKGANIGSKGAGYHNFLLNQNPHLKSKYEMIHQGDRILYYYTTNKKYPVFGFSRSAFPYELDVEMDVDIQFEKSILNILNRLNIALGMHPFNNRLTMMYSIFGDVMDAVSVKELDTELEEIFNDDEFEYNIDWSKYDQEIEDSE